MVLQDNENRNILKKSVVYLIFSALVLFQHIPMTYVSDDVLNVQLTQTMTNGQFFWERFYSNGRIVTDVAAFMLCRIPIECWKVLNTGVFLLIAVVMAGLFTSGRWDEIAMTCMLILLYPIWYLASAGYIATSTNYLYPILCLLLVALDLKYTAQNNVQKPLWYVSSLLSIGYISNHDQSAMILIGGLGLFLLYGFCMGGFSRETMKKAMLYFVLAVVAFGVMWFLPGHRNRMSSTAEMERWFPDYIQWGFAEKVIHGYTATVSHILFERVKLYGLFVFLLFLLAMQGQSQTAKITSAAALLLLGCAWLYLGDGLVLYEYQTPDFYPIGSFKWAVGMLVSACILGSMICAVCTTAKGFRKYCILGLLILGAGSREMMGFSATIYASSFRTFTGLLFALMGCCLILYEEQKKLNNKKMNYAVLIGTMLLLVI